MRQTILFVIALLVMAGLTWALAAGLDIGERQTGWPARAAAVAFFTGSLMGTLAILYGTGVLQEAYEQKGWDLVLGLLSFLGPVAASFQPLFGLEAHVAFYFAAMACFAWAGCVLRFLWEGGITRWTGVSEPFFPIIVAVGAVSAAATGVLVLQ